MGEKFQPRSISSQWSGSSLAIKLLDGREILQLSQSGLVKYLILGLLHLIILEIKDLLKVECLLSISVLSE